MIRNCRHRRTWERATRPVRSQGRLRSVWIAIRFRKPLPQKFNLIVETRSALVLQRFEFLAGAFERRPSFLWGRQTSPPIPFHAGGLSDRQHDVITRVAGNVVL